MSDMRKSVVILAALLLILPFDLLGQEKGDSLKTEVLPLIDIAGKADELESFIDKKKEEDQVSDEIASLREELDLLNPEIDSLIIYTEFILEFEIEQSKMADARNHWNRKADAVGNFQTAITKHSSKIEQDISELKNKKEVWVTTRDMPRELEIPEVTKGQIDSAILILDHAIQGLNDTLNQLIDFNGEVQKTINTISKYQARILEFQQNYLSATFERTANPIWRRAEDQDSLIVDYLSAKKLFESSFKDSKKYAVQHSYYLVWTLLFFALFYLTFIFSKSREGLVKSGNLAINGTHAIFKKPWFSGIFISLILTQILVFENPPELIGAVFFSFIILISYSVQGFFISNKGYRFLSLGLFVLFISGILIQQRILDPYLKRNWFIFLAGASTIVLGYSYFLVRKTKEEVKGYENLFFFFFIFGILAGLILNMLGYLRMGLFLQRSLITSYYVGYILLILLGISKGYVHILLKAPFLEWSRVIQENRQSITRGIYTGLTLVSSYIGLRAVLNTSGIWEILLSAGREFIEKEWEVGTSKLSIEAVLFFFLILLVSLFTANALKILLEREILGRLNLKKGVPLAFSLIVKYTLVVIGFFFAIGATGIDLDRVGFIAGALGVGIGFGLQNVVANFISGLILVFERPINKGDTVTVGQTMGKVLNIGIRASTIRTFKGAEVVVPNNDLVAKEVINWTLSDTKRRVELRIPVAFGNNPLEVAKVIEESAAKVPELMEEPAPQALFVGYENGVLNFRVLLWTTGDVFVAESKGGMFVHDGLEKNGIKVEKPNMNIDVNKKD